MKNITKTILPILLIAGFVTGCGNASETAENSTATENTENTQSSDTSETSADTQADTQNSEISDNSQSNTDSDADNNNNNNTGNNNISADTETQADGATAGGKVLVAYYSAQSHTQKAAELIANELGADTFVITPKQPYTDDDLNWSDDNSRVVKEHEDENRHTELTTTTVENWDDYDTVLIGYPIWWGEAAWVVDDFVKNNDFSGKTVIPFCTSFSSSIGDSGTKLAEMAGTGNWQEGMRFEQDFNDSDVTSWADSLGLK